MYVLTHKYMLLYDITTLCDKPPLGERVETAPLTLGILVSMLILESKL